MNDRLHLRNLIGCIFIWTSSTFGYYLISYQLKYIKGDFYINNITSAATEVFANLLAGFIFQILGINLTCIISYSIGLAGMFCLIFIKTDNQAFLSLFILGSKFGATQMFNTAYIGNTYLFPVSLVATSYSVCNFFARMASIFAPFVAEL